VYLVNYLLILGSFIVFLMLFLDSLGIQVLVFKGYQIPAPKVHIVNPDTTGFPLDPPMLAPKGIRDLESDGCSSIHNIFYIS